MLMSWSTRLRISGCSLLSDFSPESLDPQSCNPPPAFSWDLAYNVYSATGGASLSDIYKPSKRAYAIGIWGAGKSSRYEPVSTWLPHNLLWTCADKTDAASGDMWPRFRASHVSRKYLVNLLNQNGLWVEIFSFEQRFTHKSRSQGHVRQVRERERKNLNVSPKLRGKSSLYKTCWTLSACAT